ncbi:MAG: hypothetical protein HYY60_01130 [Parcubacteria group bacterium]|nr:hypothetical protein [Parcubacteria group bacterium]
MDTRKTARALALDLLDRSPCRVQIAAVLVDANGRIFAWGWNHKADGGAGKHAEAHAIERANKRRLRGATIVVAGRRKKNGNILCARPCEAIQPTQHTAHTSPCMKLLEKHGIEMVEHTTASGAWATLTVRHERVK